MLAMNVWIPVVILLAAADSDAQAPVNCTFEWTEWTACDPGPCNHRRNRQTRTAVIISAPQFGGRPCPFNVGSSIGIYSVVNHDSTSKGRGIIEYKACTPTSACYNINYCMPGQVRCAAAGNKCIPNYINCQLYYYCQGYPNAAEIPNLADVESGIHRIDSTERQKILENKYIGNICKTATIGGVTYKIPGNFDSYGLISVAESGWTYQQLSTMKEWIADFTANLALLETNVVSVGLFGKLTSTTNKHASYYMGVTTHAHDRFQHKVPSELEVTPSFESEAKRLPALMDYELYFKFLSTFGTDVVVSSVRGGHIRMMVQLMECFSSIQASGSTKAITDIPKILVEASLASNSSSQLSTLSKVIRGGNVTLAAKMTPTSLGSWLQTVGTRPAPFFADLEHYKFRTSPIYQLLDSDYLQLMNESQVRNNLQDVIEMYTDLFDQELVCQPCRSDQTLVVKMDSTSGRGDYMCACLNEKDKLTCSVTTPMVSPLMYILLLIGYNISYFI